MIKEKTITLKIRSLKFHHFDKSLHKKGDIIEIPVTQLSKGSHIEITSVCDNCGNEKKISYKAYMKTYNRSGHYFCKKCSVNIDNKITCIEKYGVDNVMKVEDIKEKMYNTNLVKYGNICSVQSDEIKKKSMVTIYERYGTYNIFSSEEILDKVRKTKEDNNSQCLLKDKEKYIIYRKQVDKLTRRIKKTLICEWDGIDFYDGEYIKDNFNLDFYNKDYPSIDHKVSVYYGFINDIPIEEIASINNLCLTKRSINSQKRHKNYDEFKIK